MEPECSLPHSQVPATCPYPEPDQSSPCPHIPLPEVTSKHKFCSSCANVLTSSLSRWTIPKKEWGRSGNFNQSTHCLRTWQLDPRSCSPHNVSLSPTLLLLFHTYFCLSYRYCGWDRGADIGPKRVELTSSLFQLVREVEPTFKTCVVYNQKEAMKIIVSPPERKVTEL